MKRIIVVISISAFFIIACHKKAVPVISSRTEFPSAPKTTGPPVVENSPEAIAAGKILYNGKCNRCHDLKGPAVYTQYKWESILKTMIPRARLDESQAKKITAYVMANAKK